MNKTAYLYVDEHSISSSLICPVCLDILEDPHTHLPCDSAFCRSCLLQLAEPLCPICRWTWNDSVPLQYNIYLPKASRLIRNMLDDLLVRCRYCHTVRRRGQFEHECQPNEQSCTDRSLTIIWKENRGIIIQMLLSVLVVVLFATCIYYYRDNVFENAIDRHAEMINEIGYNLDYLLIEKSYDLLVKLIEYSMVILCVNLCLWFCIRLVGDRLTSKINSRLLRNFFEVSIIINLIMYSIYN